MLGAHQQTLQGLPGPSSGPLFLQPPRPLMPQKGGAGFLLLSTAPPMSTPANAVALYSWKDQAPAGEATAPEQTAGLPKL